MKKKLILSLCLLLYIVPMLFTPSYGHSAILTEQNMSKEFSMSDYGDESNQSVTSFSETLESDIMHFPDGDHNYYDNQSDAGTYSPSGSGDYEDTYSLDTTYFYATSSGSPYDAYIYLNFTFSDDTPQYGYFEINMYGKIDFTYPAAYTDNSLYAYNFITETWVDTGDNFIVDNTLGWINTTAGGTGSNLLMLKYVLEDTDGDSKIYIDYAEAIAYYPDLSNKSANYIETFTSIDDWTYISGDLITSDGDIGIITHTGDASYKYHWFDTPFIEAGAYLEVAFRCDAVASTGLRIRLFDDTYPSGSSTRIINSFVDTVWTVKKVYCTQDIESVRVGFATNVASQLELDYLSIMYENETGCQHDFTTTRGITTTGDTTLTAGSDHVKIYSMNGDGEAKISVDPTDTQGTVSTEYYPFLELYVGGGFGTFPSIYSLKVGLSDGTNETLVSTTADRGLMRFNLNSITSGLDLSCIYVSFFDYGTNSIDFDYFKLYSIANYTLTSGSASTSEDYLYCEDNALIAHITEATNAYWILDYDPAIDVSLYYNNYSLDVTTNTQWFAEYVSGDGWQSWHVDEPTGTMLKGTVTDFKLLLDGTTLLSSIKFIETLSWEELSGVTCYIVIVSPYGDWAIQAFIIMLGLILIPASTIYLVKGGREALGIDKTYYFLIAFIMGWALLLGGLFL